MSKYLTLLEKLPTLKNLFIFSTLPLFFMTIMIMLPAIIGVTTITGDYPLEEIEVLEEPDRTLISNYFQILFSILPFYVLGMIFFWIFIIILMGTKSIGSGRGKKVVKYE